MTKNRKIFFGVLLVFMVAMIFRFWKLIEYPVHSTMDEVAIGYNAYSILKTGNDEWGAKMPLSFRSVGDYKPPVDIYLTVPSIAGFGLNEFAVRFPVAILGALTAVVMIWFARMIGLGLLESFFAGIFVAVSPWHVHFSRAGFEAITALFFFVLGTALFIYWTKKKKTIHAILSALCFGLSVWSYHSERALVPLFVVFLFFVLKNKIKLQQPKTRKQFTFFVIAALVLAIPFIYLTLFTPAIRTRALSTSIFRDISLTQNLHNGIYNSFLQKLFDNDWYLIYRHWLGKYLNYFDIRFWFWKGLQFTPPGYTDLGLMYLADMPLFFAGVYAIARSKDALLKKITLALFFLGPLPASITMNEQHPLRALVWLPFFAIVTAAGFGFLYKLFQNRKRVFLAGYSVLLLLNVYYFSDIYRYQFPNFFAEYWQYGYKQAAFYACTHWGEYDKIVISDTFGTDGPLNTGVPAMYVLFYCQVDPQYHLTGGDVLNISYGRPNWDEAVKDKQKVLYIAAPWDFPLDKIDKNQIVEKVDYPSGETAFLYVKNRI